MDPILKLLADEWTPKLFNLEPHDNDETNKNNDRQACEAAIRRTIPFFLNVVDNVTYLNEENDELYVCRHFSNVVEPLTERQVAMIQSMASQHSRLRELRKKLLSRYPPGKDDNDARAAVRRRILISNSKSELDELYRPPPSIVERLKRENPHLVNSMETLWKYKDYNNAPNPGVISSWLFGGVEIPASD